MDRVEKAVQVFESGMNCCQSVLGAYAEDFGIDPDAALRLSTGFGGGIGNRAETCGAVTGAFMVIGLKWGRTAAEDTDAKWKTYDKMNVFEQRFCGGEDHEAITCREILGCDISTEEGARVNKEQSIARTKCPRVVRDAVVILEGMLRESE